MHKGHQEMPIWITNDHDPWKNKSSGERLYFLSAEVEDSHGIYVIRIPMLTWDDVVGEAIAAHVQPVRLADGVLVVEVDEPAWATQFRFLADGVRERLAADVGVIVERIDVRVAGGRGLR